VVGRGFAATTPVGKKPKATHDSRANANCTATAQNGEEVSCFAP
jgi:hypothetical protein